MHQFLVYRQGRTYGVYQQPGIDGTGQSLVEGGFFTRAAAEAERERRYLAEDRCPACGHANGDHGCVTVGCAGY